MHNMTVLDRILERFPDEEFIKMDGYDDCIIGVADRINFGPVLVYDVQKLLAKLEDSGMDSEEAVEYFEFNQRGSYVGEKGPIFFDSLEWYG